MLPGLLHPPRPVTRSALDRLAASRTATMRPWLMTPTAVDDRQQLVVVGRDQDHRLAGARRAG